MSKGMTYLMTDGNLYKIGKSVNPKARLSSLRSGNINVQLLFYGNGISEKELHKMYSNKRVGLEWFDLSKEDVEDIKHLLGGLNPYIEQEELCVLDVSTDVMMEIYLMIDEAKGMQEMVDDEDGEIVFLSQEQSDKELINFVKHLIELNHKNNTQKP